MHFVKKDSITYLKNDIIDKWKNQLLERKMSPFISWRLVDATSQVIVRCIEINVHTSR